MLVHPSIPIVVGTAAISALVWSLAELSPMPAELSSPHAKIEGTSHLAGCETCHSPAGLTAGCLSCHIEIGAELEKKQGYHPQLVGAGSPDCARCHVEHKGLEFEPVNDTSWGAQAARGFKHPHVKFGLNGAHDVIACEACHQAKYGGSFTLPGFAGTPRQKTFLGLAQACERCHADPHASGLSGDCGRCHGQQKFEPPTFDHGKKFPLTGGHATGDCKKCHLLPDPKTTAAGAAPHPFPFDKVQGKMCVGCHSTPHNALVDRCDRCHPGADPAWGNAVARVTPDLHEVTGFGLHGPHAQVACEMCHERQLPFKERYRDRTAPGYVRNEETCQGCHMDVHRGQFAGRYDRCLDCHDMGRFKPHNFGLEAHARRYPLTGAHRAVACTACHDGFLDAQMASRRFTGTDHACRSCHESSHGPQFQKEIAEKDCVGCHEPGATTWKIRPWDHRARTGYGLEGAHYHLAKCESCHVPLPMPAAAAPVKPNAAKPPMVPAKTVVVRRYEGTPKECNQCHRDAHRGQFDFYGKDSCTRCHMSYWSWKDLRFNHDTQSRFRLEGAHAKVACVRCHVPVKVKDGTEVVQYRPLNMECRSCHDIPTGKP